MRNNLLMFVFTFGMNFISYSQTQIEVSRSNELTWLGVDFGQSHLYNFDPSITCDDIKKTLITYWSMDPLSKTNENYIKNLNKKESLKVILDFTKKRNSNLICDSLITDKPNELDMDGIKNIVSGSNIEGSGFGILLVVESFDNKNGRALIWRVYVNLNDKKIISARRYNTSVPKFISTRLLSVKSSWMWAIEETIRESAKELKSLNK